MPLPDTEIQQLTTASGGITSTTVVPVVDTADTTQDAEGSAYKVTAAQLAEYIRDTIGTALAAGVGVTITVNDAGDLITVAATKTVVSLTDAATVALDASLGSVFKVTLGGNRTLAITNPTDGQVIELIVTQDGTGSRTLTLPASVNYGTDAPSSLYTLSTTAGKRDRLVLAYSSAASKWDFVSFMRGF